VTFKTADGKERTIKAKKPSHYQMLKLLTLSIKISELSGKTDATSQKELIKIMADLPKLAAEISIDDKLDEEFWSKGVTSDAL